MKKKLLTILMAGAMMLSCFTGMTMSAKAANTTDTQFDFNSVNTSGYSEWRSKMDASSVYVYPLSGPQINYTVEGRIRPIASPVARSSKVSIPLGVKGSIINYVRESGEPEARLSFEAIKYSSAYTRGLWSPDSTRNYTIFR